MVDITKFAELVHRDHGLAVIALALPDGAHRRPRRRRPPRRRALRQPARLCPARSAANLSGPGSGMARLADAAARNGPSPAVTPSGGHELPRLDE